MSGWIPCPVDGWAEAAEFLTTTGGAWPEVLVIADLRWHVDQRRKLPGRPALRKRWGWSDWQVRSLLSNEARWQDPLRQRPSNSPPAPLQPTSNHGEVEPEQSADILQLPSSSPPAPLHTRGDPQPPSPSQVEDRRRSPKSARASSRTPDGFDRASDYWLGEVAVALGRTRTLPLDPKVGQGLLLVRALAKHGTEQVLAAMHYVAAGRSSRALFLRGERPDQAGNTFKMTMETLCRHVPTYAELDAAEADAPVRSNVRGDSHRGYVPEPIDPEVEERLYQEALARELAWRNREHVAEAK